MYYSSFQEEEQAATRSSFSKRHFRENTRMNILEQPIIEYGFEAAAEYSSTENFGSLRIPNEEIRRE